MQRSRKGGGLVGGQGTGQVLIKFGLDLRLGRFQAFGFLGGVQKLAAAVIGAGLAHQIAFCFQVFGAPGDGRLVGVQQLGQRRLGAAGVMAQRVDQVDLRRANALFPQGKQYQLLCLAGNFGNFAFGNIHSRLRIRVNWLHLHRCTCNNYSLLSAFVNKSRKFIPAAQYKKQNRHTQPSHFVLYLFYIMV